MSSWVLEGMTRIVKNLVEHAIILGMAAPSDTHKGYPEFTRLNPIIDWNYEQVWTFLRDFQVPYCSLYDEGKLSFSQGYTYLGNKNNTTKN